MLPPSHLIDQKVNYFEITVGTSLDKQLLIFLSQLRPMPRMPFIISHTSWACKVMAGKATAANIHENEHAACQGVFHV
jgi:cytochrome d ubiquinol oxidase subunit II